MPRYAVARRSNAPVRRSITQSPKYQKLAARVSSLAKRGKHHAEQNEHVMLTLAGAAAPALISRMSGRPLPTFMNIDPSLLYGGGALIVAQFMKPSKAKQRILAVATGMAAPGVARAVATGSFKVSGDDETGADDDVSGDDDSTGAEEII